MDDTKRNTGAAAIAHEIVDEVSAALALPPRRERPDSRSRLWQYVAAVLTGVLAMAALAGGLGRAFFVDRVEYTTTTTANAVEHEGMRKTMDRVARALDEQTTAIRDLQKTVWSGGAK